MKKNVLFACLAGISIGLSAQNAPEKFDFKLDFEQPLKQGYAQKPNQTLYINPSKNMKWDGSGKQAQNSKGAVMISAGESIYMDCYTLKSGKIYTMTLWAKAEKPDTPVSMSFTWLNQENKGIRSDSRSVKIAGTWQKLTRTVKAPENKHAYFIITGGVKDSPVWIDNFSVTEE